MTKFIRIFAVLALLIAGLGTGLTAQATPIPNHADVTCGSITTYTDGHTEQTCQAETYTDKYGVKHELANNYYVTTIVTPSMEFHPGPMGYFGGTILTDVCLSEQAVMVETVTDGWSYGSQTLEWQLDGTMVFEDFTAPYACPARLCNVAMIAGAQDLETPYDFTIRGSGTYGNVWEHHCW